MREIRHRVTSALAVLLTSLMAACATSPDGPVNGGPPPGPGRGGRGNAGGQPREDQTWTQYDVNGDGKVTRTEFLAARRLCFVRYDANEDATLTSAEVRRRLASRAVDEVGAVMTRMDLNRDGEVSREEFDQDSDRLFQFLDTNGDGVIAGMELTALASWLPGDICHASGSRGGGESREMRGPQGGSGPRGRP